jgi:hypothetical protein
MSDRGEEIQESRGLRTAGFRLLLQTRAPVAQACLARAAGSTPAATAAMLGKAVRCGAARLDDRGHLVAIAGLSVVPSRHEITAWGRRFWTWCAYDGLGILAALGADGELRTAGPGSGAAIKIRFTDGTPQPAAAALFLPDRRECGPVIDDWCPDANLFATGKAAAGSARSRRAGQVVPLAEAVRLAAGEWRPLVPAAPPVPEDTRSRTRLFFYGTLRDPVVQVASFGRELGGSTDVLPGFRLDTVEIGDPGVVSTSGLARHPIARATGDPADRIEGTVFEISDAELDAADAYETGDYQRVRVLLGSGTAAWAYVARS